MKALRVVVLALLGVAMFLGVPLLAWGIGDLSSFFAHPVRAAYAGLVVAQSLLIAAGASRLRQAGRSRGREDRIVYRQRTALALIRLLAVAIVILAPFGDRRDLGVWPEEPVIRALGLALFVVGSILIWWSSAVLGNQFSLEVTIQEDHHLVTEGPYRHIRHPRYLGIIALALGMTLTFRSWAAAAVVAVLTAIFVWRIHDEEGLLGSEFGATWDAYTKRSRRLIPFLY